MPVPITDPFGNKKIVRAKVDIDEDTLKQVAQMTGAQYYRATDTDSLEKIYSEINKLETTTRKIKKFEHSNEMFLWAAPGGAFAHGHRVDAEPDPFSAITLRSHLKSEE